MEDLSSRHTSNTNGEDNSRRIEYLNREINNILSRIAEIERTERGVVGEKRDAINALARTFEQLHEIGAYTEPINTICAHICKIGRERGLLASERWIQEVLDPKYKHMEFAPKNIVDDADVTKGIVNFPKEQIDEYVAQFGSTWSVENSIETPSISSEDSDPFTAKKIALKPIDEMTREELQIATPHEMQEARKLKDAAREKAKRAELMLEKCDRMKVAIDPEVRGREPIPVVSAESGESGPSDFSEALREYSEIIDRAADKVEKYKPPVSLDRKFAKAVREMTLVWKPWVDEKFRKDTFSWLFVAMDEAAHGKHAAATIHSTVLPDGTKRALTREQVGDRKELINQQAMRILASWKDLVAMHRWNWELEEKAIARRAVKLHRRLSESA